MIDPTPDDVGRAVYYFVGTAQLRGEISRLPDSGFVWVRFPADLPDSRGAPIPRGRLEWAD